MSFKNSLIWKYDSKNIYKPDKEYSKAYLEEQESLINGYKEYITYLKLKNELDEHLIQCPNCDHKFYNADYSLKEVEEPLKPVLNLQEIKVYKKWLEDKDLYYSLENSINNIKNILFILAFFVKNIKAVQRILVQPLLFRYFYTTVFSSLPPLGRLLLHHLREYRCSS